MPDLHYGFEEGGKLSFTRFDTAFNFDRSDVKGDLCNNCYDDFDAWFNAGQGVMHG